MHRWQSENGPSRSLVLQIVAPILMFLLLGVFVTGSVVAQSRLFRVKPLTPDRTISGPGKKGTIQSRKEASRGGRESITLVRKGQSKENGSSAVCDVTIAPGSSPPGSYLALSGLGVSPVPGVQDDSVTDFNTPAYTFAGETYNKVGLSSNGYAIIGGTIDPGDNTTVNQNFPDSTPPNNVLAPWWTDLNPDNGGALYLAVVSSSGNQWIVMDWEDVPEFSGSNPSSFEIWIGINGNTPAGEDISYVYGTMNGNGNNGNLTVGAENKLGTHGQNYYFSGAGTLPSNGTQLRVTTTSCLAQRPWTAVGSAGTIDEDSLSSASVSNFALGFNPGTTGMITARYNIESTRDISRFCPATSSYIAIRFRDGDDVGSAARVLLTLHQSNIASGGNTTIFTFDSNVSAQPVGSAFQTFAANPPISFDFSANIYWIEAQISRSDPNAFVNLGSVQIFETDGTACP